MPVMDGRMATRQIRTEEGPSQGSMIVALTANAMLEEQNEFLADGMNAILTKPLSRDALRDLLYQTSEAQTREERDMINTREALGEEAFVKLRSRFVVEVDEFRDWLSSGDAQDFLTIASSAHKVAGSASVFGADPLRKSLKAIEAGAKLGDSVQIKAEAAVFSDVWAKTKADLLS